MEQDQLAIKATKIRLKVLQQASMDLFESYRANTEDFRLYCDNLKVREELDKNGTVWEDAKAPTPKNIVSAAKIYLDFVFATEEKY